MRQVAWSLSARRDLSGIRGYIAAFNPYAAERMVGKLVAAVEALAEYPERGRWHPRG
jgi:plasmid stabilization system protein ParE